MTLIVGVRCKDGIVVGGDSIVTYSVIEQEVKSKITIEGGQVIVGCAGSVGMSQLIQERLRLLWPRSTAWDSRQARREISNEIWAEVAPDLERAKAMSRIVGAKALEYLHCDFLFALPLGNQPTLLHFDYQANSDEIGLDLPIVAIGSGHEMALPFLAFVKRVLWKDLAPDTTADGVFGVLWTLQHVIRVNSGLGVGGDPSVAALTQHDGAWKATIIDSATRDEHREAIQSAESALREHRDSHKPPMYGKL